MATFPDREPGPQLQYWHQTGVELDISYAHMGESTDLFNSAGMIETGGALDAFRFIRGETLASFARFPSYDEVVDDLIHLADEESTPYFVSHRWLTPEHPDPDGLHLDLLRSEIQPSDLYWIDFSCLPQGTANADEVRRSLRWLMSLVSRSQPLVIRTPDDGYEQRAWCILETLAAQLISGGRGRRLLSEIDEEKVDKWEWSTLDRFMPGGMLPTDALVTVPSDRQALQLAAQALIKMVDVNLVHHYVRLGQWVTDMSGGRNDYEHYFESIPPYYLVAQCDLTKLRQWTFESCRSLNIEFSLFSSPHEFSLDSNAFFRLAEKKDFRHNVNVYELPPIATHSRRNLHWLARNRESSDSRTNLFYILTGLLAPREEADLPRVKVQTGKDKVAESKFRFDSRDDIDAQVRHQSWGDVKRLSIEVNCPPGDPRPDELFDLVVYLTELRPDDFVASEKVFGRQEFLVKAAPGSLERYLRSRQIIESRLRECFEHGLVRGATW